MVLIKQDLKGVFIPFPKMLINISCIKNIHGKDDFIERKEESLND